MAARLVFPAVSRFRCIAGFDLAVHPRRPASARPVSSCVSTCRPRTTGRKNWKLVLEPHCKTQIWFSAPRAVYWSSRYYPPGIPVPGMPEPWPAHGTPSTLGFRKTEQTQVPAGHGAGDVCGVASARTMTTSYSVGRHTAVMMGGRICVNSCARGV